jgi:hypothetical protein
MRMWMVETDLLCDRHLLGEHVECHMFAGSILKNISLKGYIEGGLCELDRLHSRHGELADEGARGGLKHKPPLPVFDPRGGGAGEVARSRTPRGLARRCPRCGKRIRRIRHTDS